MEKTACPGRPAKATANHGVAGKSGQEDKSAPCPESAAGNGIDAGRTDGVRRPVVLLKGVQHLTHFANKDFVSEGFLNKGDPWVQDAMVHDGIFGVSRHEQHLHFRAKRG